MLRNAALLAVSSKQPLAETSEAAASAWKPRLWFHRRRQPVAAEARQPLCFQQDMKCLTRGSEVDVEAVPLQTIHVQSRQT